MIPPSETAKRYNESEEMYQERMEQLAEAREDDRDAQEASPEERDEVANRYERQFGW